MARPGPSDGVMYDPSNLEALLDHSPSPSFIYVHHPHHPSTSLPIPPGLVSAQIDLVEYHTPRLLLSGIGSRITGQDAEISTFDGLSLKLRTWWNGRSLKARAKGKAKINGDAEGVMGDIMEEKEDQVILVFTHAERFRLVLGTGWSVMTRLAELTGVPCCVVLCSEASWDHVRPQRADAPEPVHHYIPPLGREHILAALLPASAHPLWSRFLDLLLSTVLPLITPPIQELHYLSLSLWPIYTASLPPHLEMTLLNMAYPDASHPPPPLEVNIKLLTDLKSQLSLALASAIESLLPRQIGSEQFVKALTPGPGKMRQLPKPPTMELTLVARFMLIAAYAASYNPAKSDVRLFGRGTGPDGKRKKGGGTRRAGYGRARIGKVPQRLLGPKPFPLDRLLALFSSLYAEHAPRPEDLLPTIGGDDSDDESPGEDGWAPRLSVAQQIAKADRRRKRDNERDRLWDMEVEALVMGTKVWALIPELEAHGLLRRTSPPDRLDNVTLRCEIDYETAKSLAKDLRITLDEYMYESAM
ncbi:hypothetical protein IAU60_004121 [Kwoniella sp. DSM 27419]